METDHNIHYVNGQQLLVFKNTKIERLFLCSCSLRRFQGAMSGIPISTPLTSVTIMLFYEYIV